MRKMFRSALALAVALAVLAVPAFGFAAGQDMATLTISNPSIVYGAVSIDIDAQASLSIGLDPAIGRGMLSASLSGAGTSALDAVFAMEDGNLKGYVQSGSTGLPYLLVTPLSELTSMASTYLSAFVDFSALTGLYQSYQAYAAKMADPDYVAEFNQKADALVAEYIQLEDGGEEEIEIFGETVTAQKAIASFTFAQGAEMIEKLLALDPDLQSLVDQYLKLLTASTGQAMTFADIMAMVKEQGVEADYVISLWNAEEGYTRVSETIDITAEGQTGSMVMTIDVKAVPGADEKMAMRFDIDVPDSDPVSFSLESTTSTDESGAVKANVVVSTTESGEEVFGLKIDGSESTVDGVHTKETVVTVTSPDAQNNGTFAITSVNTDATADAKATDQVTVMFTAQDVTANLTYEGTRDEQDGQTIYDGNVSLSTTAEGQPVAVQVGASLVLGTMPEGELLTALPDQTLDYFTATAEQQAAIMQSLQTIVGNAAGVMMQVPGIAMMLADSSAIAG